MKRTRYILLLSLLWTSVCALSAQTDAIQAQRDSLIGRLPETEGQEKLNTYLELSLNLYYYEPDIKVALPYFDDYQDEARNQKNLETEIMLKQYVIGLLFNHRAYEELIARAPGYMQFVAEHKSWIHYFNIANTLSQAYYRMEKHEETITLLKEVRRMAEQATEFAEAIPLMSLMMGNAYTRMERYEEAEQFYHEGMDAFTSDMPPSDCKFQLYKAISEIYIVSDRFEEDLELLDKWKKDLDLYHQQYRHSMSYDMWLYQQYIRLYGDMKQFDKMEHYCDLMEQLNSNDYVIQHTLYEYRCRMAMHREDWANMLKYAQKAYEVATITKQSSGVRVFKRMEAQAYIGLGMREEAVKAVEQFSEISDSIYADYYGMQLDELRTQYEVERHVMEKEQIKNLFLFALSACILLAIALGIWIYYSRSILRKNRGLYLKIKEQDRLADQLNTITTQYSSMMKDNISGDMPGNSQQRKLVEQLREYLYEERRFAKSDIDRMDIVSAISTNKTYLFEAVKAVTGQSLLEYINFIRAEEAKKMLEESPRLTVESISIQCGFNSTRTFYRFFRQHYNLSPNEYKRAAKG
ncbi:AraC family transcriptional regulator [Bacteroides sp. 214]|uniref:AraC family transcriptional regulator n=1 Tax=Bacteroides sp. 214 TaxID=2302935 RepID=UPI0013D054CD|nr:AraC family transcriptional regulator [Bacteroides sp. 214]NDW13566.1 AraC family transcriptional regulator [Bacteroides sp. 214]